MTTQLTNIVGLVERALRGDLSLREIATEWPPDIEGDEFFDVLLEDLENAVEHIPFGIVTAVPDLERWRNDWDYLWLYLDSRLLTLNRPTSVLSKLRAEVLTGAPSTTANVDRYISDAVAELSA